MVPRNLQDILDHADEFAAKFEALDPEAPGTDAAALRKLFEAAQARAAAERAITEAVAEARTAGLSWTAIAAYLGTTGEAARKRYGGKRAA